MKAIITYFFSLISLFVIFSCGKPENNKAIKISCDVNKIDLLLKDIMSKRFFYEGIKPVGEDNVSYRNVLMLKNLHINDTVFYWKVFPRLNPDSIKVSLLKDTINQFIHTNAFGINLEKTNLDTTDVKVNIDFGQNKIALKWSTYHYKFDLESCKWKVIDSVYNEY